MSRQTRQNLVSGHQREIANEKALQKSCAYANPILIKSSPFKKENLRFNEDDMSTSFSHSELSHISR
jgi:hypothetical protein